MNWQGFSDFAAMGGYGLYVWGAWGGGLLVLLAESWLALRAQRRALQAAREDTR